MKYSIQYNNGRHSCGPVVLLNALKHQGHKVSRKHLPKLARKLKSHKNGVYVHDLDCVARKMGAFRKVYRPSIDKLNQELLKGNAVAVRLGMELKDGRKVGHYMMFAALWSHRGDISYYVCNIGGRCKWMEFGDIDKHYRRFCTDWHFSHFWIVPRQGQKLRL